MNHAPQSMKYIRGEDFKIPKLGMGTWQLNEYQCTDIVKKGLEMGYRLIDTAQIYQNEEYVGAAIEQSSVPRDEIFLVSKVWKDNLDPQEVIDSTQVSLEKLRTDCIDLMLIHWPNESVPLAETLGALEELVNEGSIANFGVSNFPVHKLEQAYEISPYFICDQVEYHPFLPQGAVLEWLVRHEKFLMAYSPLARGEEFKHPILQNIATKHGVSEAQVALSWLIDQAPVVAIPKTATIDHLRSNLEALDLNLDESDKSQLNNLQALNHRQINPDFSPKWDVPKTLDSISVSLS